MKKLLLAIIFSVLSTTSMAGTELLAGHSVNAMAPQTNEEIVGFLTGGDHFKAGAGHFGKTWYAHGMAEWTLGPSFLGIGAGVVDKHDSLDGKGQFTLTAGFKIGEEFVLRWMHMSNGAALFKRGNIGAMVANGGVDFITLGVKF